MKHKATKKVPLKNKGTKIAKPKKNEKTAKAPTSKSAKSKSAVATSDKIGKNTKGTGNGKVVPSRTVEKEAVKKLEKSAANKDLNKKPKVCAEPGCNHPQISDKYCRMHYIKYWRVIINGRKQQARVNLNKYIESVSEQFPEEYMDKIKDDLTSDGKLRDRLRELGFREEYEGQGQDNPFQAENLNEFLTGIKVDD